MERRKSDRRKLPVWGNSVLAINAKKIRCTYCDKLIKNGQRFETVIINGFPDPYIFCSQFCEVVQLQKLKASDH